MFVLILCVSLIILTDTQSGRRQVPNICVYSMFIVVRDTKHWTLWALFLPKLLASILSDIGVYFSLRPANLFFLFLESPTSGMEFHSSADT